MVRDGMELKWPASSITDDPIPEAHDGGELALVRLAQADPHAFAPLYEHYAPIVYHYCLRRLSHREAARDATATVFTKAIAGLPRFQPDPRRQGSTFRAWLFAIAHNVMIDARRRHRDHASIDIEGNPWTTTLVDPGTSPEDQAIRNDDARRVHALLTQLPERQRAIVELRLAGLSGAEIAATLGLTASAVKSAQFRAYGTLRTLLQHDSSTMTPEAHR